MFQYITHSNQFLSLFHRISKKQTLINGLFGFPQELVISSIFLKSFYFGLLLFLKEDMFDGSLPS